MRFRHRLYVLTAGVALAGCFAPADSGADPSTRPDSAVAAAAARALVGDEFGQWRDSVVVVGFQRDSGGALLAMGVRDRPAGTRDGCVLVRVDTAGHASDAGWCQ